MRWLDKLLWLEPLWLAGLTPLLLLPGKLVPIEYFPILVALTFVFWPLRVIVQHRLFPSSPLNWGIIGILVWLPLNWWVAVDKPLAWTTTTQIVLGITFFYALIEWQPAQKYLGLLATFFIFLNSSFIFLGSFLLVQTTASLPGLAEIVTSQLDNTINPNVLAGVLTITLTFLFAVVIGKGPRILSWQRCLPALFCIAFGIVLIQTQSRGAYVATLLALVAIVLLRFPKLGYSALGLIAVALVGLLYTYETQELLDFLVSSSTMGGLDNRIEIWERAIYILHDFAFTGLGIGGFKRVVPLLYPYIAIPSADEVPHAHNLFLQIGVDLGLPGLICYLSIFLTTLVLLIRNSCTTANQQIWTFSTATFGSLLAMMIHGMIDAPLWNSKPAFLVWLLFALTVILHQYTQTELDRLKPTTNP